MSNLELIPQNIDVTLHGGGGGLPRALKGMAEALPDANIAAVVATGDGGSATGISREVYETVALGDAWKTVAAVSTNKAAAILKHRFGPHETADDFRSRSESLLGVLATVRGVDTDTAAAILEDMADSLKELPSGVQKHTYGCLALTALTLANGNLASEGISELSKWAAVPRNIRIMPITNERHDAVMWDNGKIIYGEGLIDDHAVRDPKQARVWLQRSRTDESAPKMYEGARLADARARLVGVGPGSIWTSEIPSVAADGEVEALAEQKRNGGILALFGNLFQERNSTTGMALSNYVEKLQGPTGPNNDREITGRPFDVAISDKGVVTLPAGLLRIEHDADTLSEMGVRSLTGNVARLVKSHIDPNDPIAHMRSEATGVEHDMSGVVSVLREHELVKV